MASKPAKASRPVDSILVAGRMKPWRPLSGSSTVKLKGMPREPAAQSSLPPEKGRHWKAVT